jgi:predicted TIM-barrel fold metal-dependent hydrolase
MLAPNWSSALLSLMTIPIIDTHQHLVYPEKWPYSWTAGIPQLAGKAFRYTDYLNASEGTGITKAIFMEAAPDDPHFPQEAKFVYELAAQPNSLIAGVIAGCRPEEKNGFEHYLETIRRPKLVGLRRILHVMPHDLSTSSCFAENLKLLPKYGLTFDLCFLARQLPLALALARRCENVQFILDHCGVPDIAGQALDPWREHIHALAALPNVACKISGVLAYGSPGQANAAGVRPFVEHCLEQFGWDRVLWGGDWPVCNITATLGGWVSVAREIVGGTSVANQAKLFHQNAERIYGLGHESRS